MLMTMMVNEKRELHNELSKLTSLSAAQQLTNTS